MIPKLLNSDQSVWSKPPGPVPVGADSESEVEAGDGSRSFPPDKTRHLDRASGQACRYSVTTSRRAYFRSSVPPWGFTVVAAKVGTRGCASTV
jgi:hypothetical protein